MVISSIDFEEVPRQNWHGETLRWSEGEDSFLALLVSLSLSGHVPALYTSGLSRLFILYLSFIATHLSFCFNLSYLTSTSHLHLHNLFTYLYDGIILWTIIPFYSSLIYMQDPKLQVPVVFEVNWSLNSLDWECKPNLNEHEWISVRKWKLTSHG